MSTIPNQKDLLAKKTDLEGILKPDANDILHLPDITITLAENGQFYLAGISKKLLTLIGNTSGNAVTLDGDAGLTFSTSGGSSTITGITSSSGNSTTLAASQSMVSAKQDALTAGTNITISNNTISATDTNTLSDLTDTAFSSLADGQVLKYNATSGKWVNGTGGGGAEVILGTTAPTAAQGSNGNLYIQYDDTNNNTVTHEYVKISGAWEEIAIGGGGGSTTTVTVTPKVLTGINIADITVGNGNTTDIYDYTYFDGSGYYETPFIVDTDHEYEITFEANYDDTMAVIGTYAGPNYFQLTIYRNSWYVGTNSGEVNPSAYTTGKHTFKTDSSHTYLDDTQFTSYTPAVVNNYITIGARENTYLYKGKFYEFKIKSISTGNVLYDLVPGMRGTAKGLYDLVSDTFVECSFITNMGTKTGTSGGVTTQLYAPSIEANPSGTATDSLSSIEIDGTVYNVGGGGASLPNNYTVTADSLKIKNEAPSTGVDWIVEDDTDYFDSAAGITVSTRVYQKTNAVPALGGVYTLYASGNTWTTVMFTSTDATAVAYSDNADPFGSFTYLGHTWYFSGTNSAWSGDRSSEVSGARYIGDFSQYDYSTKECCIEAAKYLIDHAGVSFEGDNFTAISRPSTGYIIAGGGSAPDFSDATFKVTKQGDIYSKGNLLEDIFQKKSQELTSSQYENLTLAEKTNGTIYFISDPVPGVRQLISRVSAADSHISASSSVSEYPPWAAFNGEDSGGRRNPISNTTWIAGDSETTPWIQYHFDEPYYLTKAELHIYSHYSSSGNGYQGNLYILGSNDGSTWTNISITGQPVTIDTGPSATGDSGSGLATVVQLDYDLNPSNQYEYIRFQGDEFWNKGWVISVDFDDIYVYGTDQGSPIQKIYYMDKCYTNTGGGGGGGDISPNITLLNDGTITDGQYVLSEPISNFDEINFIIQYSNEYINSKNYYPKDLLRLSSSSTDPYGVTNFLIEDYGQRYLYCQYIDETHIKPLEIFSVLKGIYGIKYKGGGGSASAKEMTLAEYSELTEQQKNDGTIRFIPAGSGSEALTAVDMTDITVYKEGAMNVTAVSSSEIDVTWDSGTSIGCNFDFNTPIDVTDYDRIIFKVTNGSCYGNGTQAMLTRWDMMIGLMSAPLGELTNIEPTDSRWIVVADMPLSNHVYEETLDVSGLIGSYYLVVSAHGWNTTIEDITLRQGGDYPSQIRYMSKTYGISSGGGGGNPELEETALLTTPITAEGTYTLLDNIEDYDFVSFVSGVSNEADIRLLAVSDMLNMLDDNLVINCAGTAGRWFNITALSGTSITITKYSETIIQSIMGYKYKGGGSNTNVAELTQSEYNALPDGEKNNGYIYMVSSQTPIIEELTEAKTGASTAVTASSYNYDTNFNQYHYPWCAFNRVSPNPNEMAYPTPGVTTQTCWTPNVSQDGSNSWICYHFDRAYKMTSMTINSFTDYSSSATKSMIIEGSNDGTTWTNILSTGNSFSLNSDLHTLTTNNVNLNSDTAYEYVRLRSLEPMGASYQPSVFIDEIFVYGYKSEETLKKIYYMGTEYGNTGGGEGGSFFHTYSTTEQKVGTWIDGSDIYEKSFEVTITQSSSPIIEQDASYIDALISYDAVVKNSLGYISGVGMDASGWNFALHRNPSAQLLLYGNVSEAIGGKAYVTIRYTKVTQGQN